MKIAISTILILIVNYSFAQVNNDFLNDFLLEDELQKENIANEYAKYDFSNLWTSTEDQFIYGIIGENHQRLRIKLITIEKNPFDSFEYIVKGKSMVKEVICEFVGVIRIEKIKEVKELHYGVDDEFKDKGISRQGILIAKYEFLESKSQKFSGLFKGELYSKWYLDSSQIIKYDDIQALSDNYMNNAFIGIWKSYTTSKEKKCNWGDYRVPQANQDFDIGVGELSISEKYWNNGWIGFASRNQDSNDTIIRNKSKVVLENWWEDK